MSNIAQSLATLVKYNAGFFKSEKQAKFLLSVTGGCFVVSNAVNLGYEYNNKRVGQGATTSYILDDKGIVLVERKNAKGVTTVFDRNDKASVQANKERLEAIKAKKERDAIAQAKWEKAQELRAFDEALGAHIKALLNTSVQELYSNETTAHLLNNHAELIGTTNKIKTYADYVSCKTRVWLLDTIIIHEGLPTMADKIDEVTASDYYKAVKTYREDLRLQIKAIEKSL